MPGPAGERPNILLVVFDTARADAFEPYGASAGASPTVAQLAARGAALSHMYSTAPWTLPSHTSMFTGRLAREVGLGQSPGGDPTGARPTLEGLRDVLLPAVLSVAGYATQAVSANVWLSRASGFATGFDEFVETTSHRQATLAQGRGRRARLAAAWETMRARTDDGAAAAEEVLERWIDGWSGSPTFWFVNLVECHSPYMPPAPYDDHGPLRRLRVAREAREYLTIDAIWRACLSDFAVPDGALERMRHLYAQSVRYMDDWLARILSALDRRGILDETLVIVTSDHGENFGEGGLLAHGWSVDDRLVHVPFVAAGPGAPGADGVRSLTELPLILADAAGLENHPWAPRGDRGSVAIAQWDFPGEQGDPRIDALADEWGLDDAARALMSTDFTAATDGRHKLVRRGTRDDHYDLSADPLEISPLPAAEATGEAWDRLRTALDDPQLHERVHIDPPGATTAPTSDEAEHIERQMRLLGYM